MKRLKEVVDKQRDEIRAKDRELGLKNEDVEAVSDQRQSEPTFLLHGGMGAGLERWLNPRASAAFPEEWSSALSTHMTGCDYNCGLRRSDTFWPSQALDTCVAHRYTHRQNT